MRAVWLIGSNVVREQRWFILLMLVYLAGFTGMMVALPADLQESDALFVLQQETLYGIFFSVVIALAIFQNERKTRRILAVLSKAVSRSQFLAGTILGVNLATLIFYAAMYAGLFALFPHARVSDAAGMMLSMVVASLLASVVTVLYAAWMHPILATAAAGTTLALPMVLEKIAGPVWAGVLPVYRLVHSVLRYTPQSGFDVEPGTIALALLECVVLWGVASWLFSRRDVTVALE